jgi:hypothetical protein
VAVQIARLLRWPVAADVLSGLRVGAAGPAAAGVPLVDHFDHLLLGGKDW